MSVISTMNQTQPQQLGATSMKWEDTRLTTEEADAALIAAGIDPNPETWNEAMLDRATRVLEEAQKAKLRRLIAHKLRRK